MAQNQEYWREGFEPSATPACNLGTVSPTATGGLYFNGNVGSWYGFNVYRTTGTGCPAGNNHVRYKNISGVTDSGYLVTPIVSAGIQEFHMYRARASRSYTIWMTSDTSATTTNWTPVALMKSSALTVTCVDTTVIIAAFFAISILIKLFLLTIKGGGWWCIILGGGCIIGACCGGGWKIGICCSCGGGGWKCLVFELISLWNSFKTSWTRGSELSSSISFIFFDVFKGIEFIGVDILGFEDIYFIIIIMKIIYSKHFHF